MPDTTRIQYLYPPNFTGTQYYGKDAMFRRGHRKYIVLCTNDSDGSGEDEALKIKRTDLRTTNGNVPSKLVIEKIKYAITGMKVNVGYNNVNEEIAALLNPGEDCIDFTPYGGFTPEDDTDNEGGDIIFTTIDHASGYSYNIILEVRPKD